MKKQCKFTKIMSMLLMICILFGCVACAGPVDSPEPTDPTTSTTAPTDPGSPTNPENPTNPGSPADPVNPTDPESPTEPSDPTEPTDPIGPDVPAVNPETDPEKIFIKTIHDFEGYRVENLDDQEDTNFVVYAKGVQELTATATSNVLQSVEENTLTYTFTNPDAAMKVLQPGDVFFVGVTEQTPNGDTVKVKSIKLSGNSAVIQGDEVKLEDIYIYIDVDMSLDSIPVEAEQSTIARRTGSMEANQVKLEDRVFRIPLLFSTGTASNGPGTSISGSGLIKGGLKNTRLTMRYSLMHCYFSVQLDSHLFVDATMELECKGSIKYSPEAPLIAPIPLPFLPGQFLIVNLAALTEGYVQLDGKMEFHSAYDIGMSYNVYDGIKSHFDHAGTTKDLDLSVEGGLSHSVGLKIGVGIPKVWDAYVQGDFGVSLEGEMTFPGEEDYPKDAESIHDCDKCIDGVCHLFVQGTAGVELKVAEELWGISVGASLSTPRKSLDKVDFYYSFRGEKKEFGLEDCPHKRWRTTFNAKGSNGEPIDDLDISVEWYNSSKGAVTDTVTTNASGKAVLYLPDGEWTAWYQENGNSKSAEVNISGEPVSLSLELDTGSKVFVYSRIDVCTADGFVTAHSDITFMKNILALIKARYPNAILVDEDEYDSIQVNDRDIVLQLEWAADHDNYSIGKHSNYQLRIQVFNSDMQAFYYQFFYGFAWASDEETDEIYYCSAWQMCENIELKRYDLSHPESVYSYETPREEGYKDYPYLGVSAAYATPILTQHVYDTFSEYVAKTYQYVDLWLSGEWNEKVDQLIPQ